ncbi:hypothetical protein BD560DRAFT_438734 [Blakeslea trispora]|nr:hypothetical protein BD560DRAFT_438734 [Blakeslea trispora]
MKTFNNDSTASASNNPSPVLAPASPQEKRVARENKRLFRESGMGALDLDFDKDQDIEMDDVSSSVALPVRAASGSASPAGIPMADNESITFNHAENKNSADYQNNLNYEKSDFNEQNNSGYEESNLNEQMNNTNMQRLVIEEKQSVADIDTGRYQNNMEMNYPVTPKITEEKLVQRYQNKINLLFEATLECDNIEELQKLNVLIEQLEKLKNLLVNKNKNDSKNADNNSKTIKNQINKNEIPIFQFIDDPADTKTDNRTAHANAEGFISAFELTMKINDINIDVDWKKYLTTSFLYGRNNKHMRWYQNHINVLDDHVKWDQVKQAIIDRFGDINDTKKIRRYINIKQGKSETIRDYIDRYLEAFNRLPIKYNYGVIQTASFIESLLPVTKEEVEKSLKANYESSGNTHYPESLASLFKFLEKHIGDIQEALYLSLAPKAAKNEEREDRKRDDRSHLDQQQQQNAKRHKTIYHKAYQPTVPLCGHCKIEPFSPRHLETCKPYLAKKAMWQQNGSQQNK